MPERQLTPPQHNKRAEVLECGHSATDTNHLGTGYGILKNGDRHCYECCSESEKKTMQDTGRAVLYLTGPGPGLRPDKANKVTNWSGLLSFNTGTPRKGRHNIAGTRYDVWFRAFGSDWWGVQYGDNTQLCHCKRIKTA